MFAFLAISSKIAIDYYIVTLTSTRILAGQHNPAIGAPLGSLDFVTTIPAAINQIGMILAILSMASVRAKWNNVYYIALAILYDMLVHQSRTSTLAQPYSRQRSQLAMCLRFFDA
jgi:hypothetical protein